MGTKENVVSYREDLDKRVINKILTLPTIYDLTI